MDVTELTGRHMRTRDHKTASVKDQYRLEIRQTVEPIMIV